jgi:hypothetical protein
MATWDQKIASAEKRLISVERWTTQPAAIARATLDAVRSIVAEMVLTALPRNLRHVSKTKRFQALIAAGALYLRHLRAMSEL